MKPEPTAQRSSVCGEGGAQHPAPPWHPDPQLLLQISPPCKALTPGLLPGTSGFLKWMGDASSALVTCYSIVFSKGVKYSWRGAGYALLPSGRDELFYRKKHRLIRQMKMNYRQNKMKTQWPVTGRKRGEKKKARLLGRTGTLKTEELISIGEVGWSSNTLHRAGTFSSCPEQSSTLSLGFVLGTWSHHPHPCPEVKGLSQGQGSSWGKVGALGAALLLQHSTPDPGSAQSLMLQAALELLDQLQKVTLSVGVHPTTRHMPPFPQSHPALGWPSLHHPALP